MIRFNRHQKESKILKIGFMILIFTFLNLRHWTKYFNLNLLENRKNEELIDSSISYKFKNIQSNLRVQNVDPDDSELIRIQSRSSEKIRWRYVFMDSNNWRNHQICTFFNMRKLLVLKHLSFTKKFSKPIDKVNVYFKSSIIKLNWILALFSRTDLIVILSDS